jgi:kexin
MLRKPNVVGQGPGYLVEKAFVNGIYNGRGGKGSVFVFASGNGAWSDDQCNFDGRSDIFMF